MNQIKETDFFKLIDGRDCHLVQDIVDEGHSAEERKSLTLKSRINEFAVTIEKGLDYQVVVNNTSKKTACKINFEKLNLRRKTIGTAGELLVLDYENERLKQYGSSRMAEHVADTQGDGLGYDIKSYDDRGAEMHIEVKTTKANISDGFYLSAREFEASQETDYQYKIYRVFGFDDIKKEAKIAIYDGSTIIKKFELKPVSYKVLHKK